MFSPPVLRHTFIVRLWHEPGGPEEAEWRGELTHLPDGGRSFFREVETMSHRIQAYLESDEEVLR